MRNKYKFTKLALTEGKSWGDTAYFVSKKTFSKHNVKVIQIRITAYSN